MRVASVPVSSACWIASALSGRTANCATDTVLRGGRHDRGKHHAAVARQAVAEVIDVVDHDQGHVRSLLCHELQQRSHAIGGKRGRVRGVSSRDQRLELILGCQIAPILRGGRIVPGVVPDRDPEQLVGFVIRVPVARPGVSIGQPALECLIYLVMDGFRQRLFVVQVFGKHICVEDERDEIRTRRLVLLCCVRPGLGMVELLDYRLDRRRLSGTSLTFDQRDTAGLHPGARPLETHYAAGIGRRQPSTNFFDPMCHGRRCAPVCIGEGSLWRVLVLIPLP